MPGGERALGRAGPRARSPGLGWTRVLRDQTGAGSLLVVAILAAVLCVVATVLPLQFALSRRHAMAGAADAAALAAADARSGAVAGVPCDLAARVASANGARLDACAVDGLVATVRVSTRVLGITVTATASAGPPARGMD